MALEVYTQMPDSEDESEEASPPVRAASRSSREPSLDPSMASAFSRLDIDQKDEHRPSSEPETITHFDEYQPSLPPIKTSLSLLEMLLRLLSLQQFQQTPHLSIPDELLTFFLSESASTGAASGDLQERKRLREEARRHVGFDPYDESPVKRRGEDYQNQYRGTPEFGSRRDEDLPFTDERYGSPIGKISPRYEDEGYITNISTDRLQSSSARNSRHNTPQTPLQPPRTKSYLGRSKGSLATPERKASLLGSKPSVEDRAIDDDADVEEETIQRSPLTRSEMTLTDENTGTHPSLLKGGTD